MRFSWYNLPPKLFFFSFFIFYCCFLCLSPLVQKSSLQKGKIKKKKKLNTKSKKLAFKSFRSWEGANSKNHNKPANTPTPKLQHKKAKKTQSQREKKKINRPPPQITNDPKSVHGGETAAIKSLNLCKEKSGNNGERTVKKLITHSLQSNVQKYRPAGIYEPRARCPRVFYVV